MQERISGEVGILYGFEGGCEWHGWLTKWIDMVEAEERKIKDRETAAHEQGEQLHKQHEKKKPEHKDEKKGTKESGGGKK